jgi:ferredoxin-like protein FixX
MEKFCRISGGVLITAIIFTALFAFAHEGCLETSLGEILCPPPMGGIAKDSLGKVLCSDGQCVETKLGKVLCSRQKGGYAYINRMGHAVCTGGCEQGSSDMCQRPVEERVK